MLESILKTEFRILIDKSFDLKTSYLMVSYNNVAHDVT